MWPKKGKVFAVTPEHTTCEFTTRAKAESYVKWMAARKKHGMGHEIEVAAWLECDKICN